MPQDKKKPEFGTPQKVFDVCKSMQDVEDMRAGDRRKINRLMNGRQPYSDDEEKKYGIQINVNWGEGKRIMLDANRQLNNALLHPGILFNCALEHGRVDKRDEWSMTFTNEIHKPIQRGKSGKRHGFIIRSRNATVCMHGIGAILWPNSYRWMGRFVPLEDLLIPTDTYCDFSNLRYFAVNLYLSPGEFASMAIGEKVDKGWNQDMARKILDAHKGLYTESTTSTWKDQPEAMAQIHDQNKGYYYSDKVPTIKLRAFYWRNVDDPKNWYRHIVLREGVENVKTDQFVYDGSGEVFAGDIDEILNVQYGDGNLVAPLKYHSVRGIGVDLFAPVETLNRLRCEFIQAVFEHLKMYFKIQDPADRDRLKQVVLQQYGFVPDGLTIIPREQRHQIDPRLVAQAEAEVRGLMQENTAQYVMEPDRGQEKEMTAREAMIKLNQATMMVNSTIGNMYLQDEFYWQEIVRRFLYKESADPEVKDFRERCLRLGIPEELLVPECWRVTPERVLGGGDRSQAQLEGQWLFQNRTAFGPKAQQTILRMAATTMLNDPAKGMLLVPAEPTTATAGTMMAESLFGTLMTGNQTEIRQGIDYLGYIAKLLQMMNAVVQRITASGGVGTVEDLIGLQTAAQNAAQHIAVLAGDEAQKQAVKQFSDILGRIMNEVKAFGQRLAEQQQSQGNQGDPAAMAKAQSTVMLAGVKGNIAQQNAAMKQRHKELGFQMEEQRKNLSLISELKREQLKAHQELLNDSAQKSLDLLHQIRANRVENKNGS